MNWKSLVSIDQLPLDRNFLIWDKECTSGIHVYEAMVGNNKKSMCCPATFDEYRIEDFSHYCEIEIPNGEQQKICKQNLPMKKVQTYKYKHWFSRTKVLESEKIVPDGWEDLGEVGSIDCKDREGWREVLIHGFCNIVLHVGKYDSGELFKFCPRCLIIIK